MVKEFFKQEEEESKLSQFLDLAEAVDAAENNKKSKRV